MGFSSLLADVAEAGEVTPAQVLIVDDSVVARTSLARMIDATTRFVVAGTVGNARQALEFLEAHPVEIIVLDLEMPGIDGLTALPDLIAAGRGARVLVVSSNAADGAAATVHALALGAADTLEKPGTGFVRRFAEVLEERLGRLVESAPEPVIATGGPPRRTLPVLPPFDIIAIGASTGGIHALSKLLRAIPPDFDVPMLVTQHLPASFMPYFAAQLALLAGKPCEVATERMAIRPGRILVAPGDAHLRCVRAPGGDVLVRLTHEASASGCMPSVDPMFRAVAEVYGARGLGVVLSGMGRDGSIGAQDLVATGGSMLVQDRASSVVWGMPGAVAGGAGATAVLPPDEIGQAIAASRSRR
ncbi:chemotaxis protein CheB [Sphingomonas sp.]|uniref:chemotaxis protein CheB n=1 Tax=Sphingomonas sp. TaxID=28214 RepID=UPI002CFEBCE1|nr:chemotaxis protein CheB [Sphingomonas sp.]HWK36173.1 chemotaxis protein CheB [Sphingomonas sp.]